jgi:hypothetical protein
MGRMSGLSGCPDWTAYRTREASLLHKGKICEARLVGAALTFCFVWGGG